MPKVSIIVPVYNTEKYLRTCLDSIMAQTFTDFEAILVDDGSTDSSGRICDEYATKDSRFVVVHKQNGGVSSARNIGIEKAKGRWVTFVDCDDWLDSHFLESFVVYDDDNKNRLIIGGCTRFGDYGGVLGPKNTETIEIKNKLSCLWNDLNGFVYWYPWGKMFNRETIIENGIRFDKSMFYSEDFIFILEYLNVISSFQTITKYEYHYLQTRNKSDKFKMSFEQFISHLNIIEKSINQIEKKCNYKFNIVRNNVRLRLFNNFISYLFLISDYKEFKKNMKGFRAMNNVSDFLKEINCSWKKRIVLLFLPLRLSFNIIRLK